MEFKDLHEGIEDPMSETSTPAMVPLEEVGSNMASTGGIGQGNDDLGEGLVNGSGSQIGGLIESSELQIYSLEEMEDILSEMDIKYAPYVRHDTYGRMGKGEITLWEKLKLGFSLLVFVPVKVFLLFMIVVTYYIICRCCTMFKSTDQNVVQDDDGNSGIIPLLRTESEMSGEGEGEEEIPDPVVVSEGQKNYAHLTGLRRRIIVYTGRFFSRAILFVLGFYWITVTRINTEQPKGLKDAEISGKGKIQPGAIVSNHASYIDILYHMSASFPSFVAKPHFQALLQGMFSVEHVPYSEVNKLSVLRESSHGLWLERTDMDSVYWHAGTLHLIGDKKRSVSKLPLIGLISECLGCVFVQREDKPSDFKGAAGIITRRLQDATGERHALSMLLFPEGTTTNGFYILPFKTGAFLAGVPIQPIILKYPYRRFSIAWDSISGVRHVILLLCQFVNWLEVLWLPIYVPSEEEKADPKLYASNVRKQVALEGGLFFSKIGLKEKRIYHSFLSDYVSFKV